MKRKSSKINKEMAQVDILSKSQMNEAYESHNFFNNEILNVQTNIHSKEPYEYEEEIKNQNNLGDSQLPIAGKKKPKDQRNSQGNHILINKPNEGINKIAANQPKRRRSRYERSLSAKSKDHGSLIRENDDIILENSEENNKLKITPLENNNSTEDHKIIEENKQSEEIKEFERIAKSEPKEVEVHLDNDKRSSESDPLNEINANYNKNDDLKDENYNNVNDNTSQSPNKDLNPNDLVLETRIKTFDLKSENIWHHPISENGNKIDIDNNELLSNEYSSKEERKSKYETEKEGEGDILDTIGDLDFDPYLDRKRPIKKVFSESNHGNINKLEDISENPSKEGEDLNFDEEKDDSDPNNPINKIERTINTVDMEAINSEESEDEEIIHYQMKTIFNWKNKKNNNNDLNEEIREGNQWNKNDSSNNIRSLQESSAEVRKSKSRLKKGSFYRQGKNKKNFDLFEILNSDKEGKSERNKEEK